MYLVLKMGVYIQDICGIYSTFEKAFERAKQCKKLEEDDYHTFTICDTYDIDQNLFHDEKGTFIRNEMTVIGKV